MSCFLLQLLLFRGCDFVTFLGTGTPCSMKDGSCLTDRKSTHMEAHGSTLILTVDDEPTNHLVIEEIVTSHGYQVNLHVQLAGRINTTYSASACHMLHSRWHCSSHTSLLVRVAQLA